MRGILAVSVVYALSIGWATGQSDPGFSGTWNLNTARSDIRSSPSPPEPVLNVQQSASALTVSGNSQTLIYPLDGRAEKRAAGGSTTRSATNTVTKWEGAALLVNTLVSGPENYTVMERWTRSRSGKTLTIRRTIVRMGGESESLLVYENSLLAETAAQPVASAAASHETAPPPTTPQVPPDYVVEKGTRVLLRLTNAVNTKHTAAGDHIYLETAVPVFVDGRMIIPRGSYVAGTVTESQQAGRVKGKSSLSLRFDSLTLPNGVTRDFRSRPGSVEARGNLDRSEGKITGEGNKGGDARTVGETTAAGTGIGAIAGSAAGHLGMGAGIGAAAGAAAGLAGILGTRGPDVVLPPGTTMELVLDRDLRFTATELNRRAQ